MGLFQILLDLIYPPHKKCLNCDDNVNKNFRLSEIEGLCQNCLGGIEFVSSYCIICGREIKPGNNESYGRICGNCQQREPVFEQARSVAVYSGTIRDLILKFKYYGHTELARTLGYFLSLYYFEYYDNLSIDYIISVPLHKKREKLRGYNQAGLLARELASKINIPVLENYLLRVENSLPLFNLSLEDRQEVMKGVFTLADFPESNHVYSSINRNEIDSRLSFDRTLPLAGSTVLLVDDIFTTGTTVNEASRILIEKGEVARVYVLTLATASLCEFLHLNQKQDLLQRY